MALIIETVYYVAFDIDDTSDARADLLKFCNAVEKLTYAKKYASVRVSDSNAGPSWNAYMECTCENYRTLAAFAERVQKLARFAHVKLNDWSAR